MSVKTYNVEILSISLVREYLSRKGYKATLFQFDKESKKRDDSIQNRRFLANELSIMGFVKRNKELGVDGWKTFLEMIVHYYFVCKENSSIRNGKPSDANSGKDSNTFSLKSSENYGRSSGKNTWLSQKNVPKLNRAEISSQSNADYDNDVAQNLVACRRKKVSNKLIHDPSQKQISNDVLNTPIENRSLTYVGGNLDIFETKESVSSNNAMNCLRTSEKKENKDFIIGYEKKGNDESAMDNYEAELTLRCEPISFDTACDLKILLFGSASRSFNLEWKQQGFEFSHHPLLKYGLVQHRGGPCGLMASVQAKVIKHLYLTSNGPRSPQAKIHQPTDYERTAALINAFVDILNSVSKSNDELITVLPTTTTKFQSGGKYKKDGLTEKLQLFYICNDEELERFFQKNVSSFTHDNGCILFLYSVILSCGIENVRNCMDEPKSTLIGSHGYCTQEMVNLMLTSNAVSNVFDSSIKLDSGGGNMSVLRGIESKSDIGFLSLFEHYKSCEVGENYKNPYSPIWVVCSESHFSVLFSPISLSYKEKKFDLYYYDGLGCQDEEIRLTVDMETSEIPTSVSQLDLIPPLEHCIKTKWKNAIISWNGTEPIL